MTDKYDEFGCAFKNEAECEEELDEEGLGVGSLSRAGGGPFLDEGVEVGRLRGFS
mgnify:CR=1 FL=1